MPRYRYDGPQPVPDPEGGDLVHPGDVRDFDAEPDWGPWVLLLEPLTQSTASNVIEPGWEPQTPGPAASASTPGPATTSAEDM